MIQLELNKLTRSLRVEVVVDGRLVIGTFYVPLPEPVIKAITDGYDYPGHVFGDGHRQEPGHFDWQVVEARIFADPAVHVEAQSSPEGT